MTSPVPNKRQGGHLGKSLKIPLVLTRALSPSDSGTPAASYPSSWSLSGFLPRTDPALLDVPKVLKLSCWPNHGAELITGLEKPTRAALSADDFTLTVGKEDGNAQESQIRAFLAWDKPLL